MDVTQLSLPQLQSVKRQLDSELEHLTTSFSALRSAQGKFRECQATVKKGVKEGTEDSPILVPLTSSLYVKGRLTSTEKVIVDIGTGYFVEKTVDQADDFYKRKVEALGKNLKDLEGIVASKSQNMRVVEELLRQKILAANSEKSG